MSSQARYSRRKQKEIADIGKIPAVVNWERRESCREDLQMFLTTYFPFSTGLSPFSKDHDRVIDRIQRCVTESGRYANVVYRGFAKTTISQGAAIWATIYGHRRFVCIFGADKDSASENIDSIKIELSENELIYQDFPEVCHAIWSLDGKPQRCASQTHIPGNVAGFEVAEDSQPKRTHISWTADKIVLPTIMLPDGRSEAAGAIITCRGVTGGSRGMVHKRADGGQQRPDFVILDDPQTDDSASTELQVSKRLGIINKAILKLGGHTKQLAVVLNATPIHPDDVVEQLLDQAKNPSWQSERIPMVRQWAKAHETLWLTEYAKIRNSYDKDQPGDQLRAHEQATAFYEKHRAEMDEGCEVSWFHCYSHENELSAIQHAYNFLIDDGDDVFQSECQCRPVKKELGEQEELTAATICGKTTNLPRGIVPMKCSHVTAFIDIHAKILFWCVAAWTDGFGGSIIDYGTFPEQSGRRFTLKDAKRTLGRMFPNAGEEGAIYAGLQKLTDDLMGRAWKRDDGVIMRIERCLIDSGYQTNTIEEFCREGSKFPGVIYPSKGFAIRANQMPFSDYKSKAGERIGHNWLVSTAKKLQVARYDTNYWKSFVYARLATAKGDEGSMTLFGKQPDAHELFASHLLAEYRVRTKGRGRELDEWMVLPHKPDNHWFDTLVGCAVAASMSGVSLIGKGTTANKEKRKRVSFAEMQKARR